MRFNSYSWYDIYFRKMSEGECVKVIVRCRPMNKRENDLKCKPCLSMESKRGQCTIKNPGDPKAPPKMFTFDGSYYTDSVTENIYNEIAYPLVEGVCEGYNGTIFAYGQTGCGKSFTMQGIVDPPTQRGVIPRTFDHIFETVSVIEGTKFLLHASYCEIYNEEIRDLLSKDVKAKLDLHEHPDKGVYVNGLTMHPVHNVADCEKIMERGWKNRATGATLMNADSSRSHSIFSVMLEMSQQDEAGEDHIRAGKLNLVDLAGSERQAKTGATSARLKEATKINLSLSALGNVISALVDGKSKHIPYRDSKLTRLLQDSLGVTASDPSSSDMNDDDDDYDGSKQQANRQDLEEEKERIREEYDARLEDMKKEYENEKVSKNKIQNDMVRLRAFYDNKLSNVDGQIADLPPTAAVLSHPDLESLETEQKQPGGGKVSQTNGEVISGEVIQPSKDGTTTIKQADGKVVVIPPGVTAVKQEDGTIVQVPEGKTAVKQPDGSVVVVPQGTKIVYKNTTNTEYITKTEYVEKEGEERPSSVMGQALPVGPDAGEMKIMTMNQSLEPGAEEEVTAIMIDGVPMLNNDEGLVAPSSSPTQTNMQDQIKHQQEEALKSSSPTQTNMQDQIKHQQEEALGRGFKKVKHQQNDEGLVAPSSSPTQTNMQDQIKHQQEEALKRTKLNTSRKRLLTTSPKTNMQDQIKHQQEEALKRYEGLVAPSSSPTQTNMQDQIKHQQEEALKGKKMMKVWWHQVLLQLMRKRLLVAPSSSPTQTNMQDQIKHQQEEALKGKTLEMMKVWWQRL
ncbi:KIF17 [Mytilus edulis]|uniref:Kinesin-like protein n=1 Tax=Mytilus edulis TaxID=6550 RepID=A0A8S3SWG0_MYTED|nr:KIF17 [Mytilus edulis]